MTRADAEALALTVQSALNACDIPADTQLVVILRASGHVLIAGNGGPEAVGELLAGAMLTFLRSDKDGTLALALHEVKPS